MTGGMAKSLTAGLSRPASAALDGSGGVSWTPLELSPVLWLDATIAASILNASDAAASNGEAVKTWKDQSGHGYDVVQTLDAADRPTKTADGITGDGTDDYLTTYGKAYQAAGGFTANTVFGVIRINTAANSKYIVDFRSSGVRGAPVTHYSAPTLSLCGQGQLPKVAITTGIWFAFCVRHADNFRGVQVNLGSEATNTTAATLAETTIVNVLGNGAIPALANTHADIKELIVVPSNITDATLREKCLSYLIEKHSLAVTLIAAGFSMIAAGYEMKTILPLA